MQAAAQATQATPQAAPSAGPNVATLAGAAGGKPPLQVGAQSTLYPSPNATRFVDALAEAQAPMPSTKAFSPTGIRPSAADLAKTSSTPNTVVARPLQSADHEPGASTSNADGQSGTGAPAAQPIGSTFPTAPAASPAPPITLLAPPSSIATKARSATALRDSGTTSGERTTTAVKGRNGAAPSSRSIADAVVASPLPPPPAAQSAAPPTAAAASSQPNAPAASLAIGTAAELTPTASSDPTSADATDGHTALLAASDAPSDQLGPLSTAPAEPPSQGLATSAKPRLADPHTATPVDPPATDPSSHLAGAPPGQSLAPQPPTSLSSNATVVASINAPPTTGLVADQIGPVLIHVASGDGARRISLQLAPESLGHLDIQIDQPKNGPATVTLTTSNPQTLALLQSDHAQLSAALDRAGIPADHRVLSFHLAEPPGDATSLASAASASPDQTGGQGGAPSNGHTADSSVTHTPSLAPSTQGGAGDPSSGQQWSGPASDDAARNTPGRQSYASVQHADDRSNTPVTPNAFGPANRSTGLNITA